MLADTCALNKYFESKFKPKFGIESLDFFWEFRVETHGGPLFQKRQKRVTKEIKFFDPL